MSAILTVRGGYQMFRHVTSPAVMVTFECRYCEERFIRARSWRLLWYLLFGPGWPLHDCKGCR